MVEKLLAGDGRRIARLISDSKAAQNFETGIKNATGIKFNVAYDEIVKKYWKR